MQNVEGRAYFHGAGTGTVYMGGSGVLKPGGERQLFGASQMSSNANSYDYLEFQLSSVARTAAETRPQNITGCFIIKVFGAVSRPGSVDAAQLATRLAALDAAFQTDIDFKLLYPGGSATTPGVIYQNTVQTIDNPFPGSPVQVVVEHELNGQWFEPGWFCSTDRTGAPNDPFSGWGLKAAHGLVTDKIIVRAGKNGTATDPAIAGGSWVGAWSQNQVNARFRLKVWKLKGRIGG